MDQKWRTNAATGESKSNGRLLHATAHPALSVGLDGFMCETEGRFFRPMDEYHAHERQNKGIIYISYKYVHLTLV